MYGPKDCDDSITEAPVTITEAPAADACYLDNTRYKGDGIKSNKEFTKEECRDWCGDVYGCVSWTLHKNSARCYLHSANHADNISTGDANHADQYMHGAMDCIE